MAIVEMKRVTLLAMAEDRDRLLHAMQRAGCVEISQVSDEAAGAYLPKDRGEWEEAGEKLARIRWTLSRLARFEPKRSMLAAMSMPETDEEEARSVAADERRLMAVVEAAEGIERRAGDLKGAEARLRARIEQLSPWKSLDIPVEEIRSTPSTVQFVGTVESRAVEGLESALEGLPVHLRRVEDDRDGAHIWIVAHQSAQGEVRDALKAAGFAPVQFAAEAGTPGRQLEALKAQLDDILKERAGLSDKLGEMAAQAPRLKLLYELVSMEKERKGAAARLLQTRSAFLLQGWVPAYAQEKLEKKLRAVSASCEVEFRDPLDDEKPPSLLANRRFASPFEAIIANYSLPDPRGVDPTFVMAPFFACFYGMMVSDAGYGLLMAIAIPLIIHFVKPKPGLKKIMWVLGIGSVFTVFWGAMFDTWFGMSIKPVLINPLEQPLEMMGLCLGLGVVHLFAGLGMGAYKNIRAGRPLDAVFDQLLWVFLLVGLGLLILPATKRVGGILAIVGAAGIFLTAGRARKNLAGKFTGGFAALYGISSWLSDILSYMRLFGMGLATGVIGMVINMLAGMILAKGIFGIIAGVAVLIVGHVFNAFINVLGAYVHACRLQYIEFFGKFYDDGGTPFSPLAPKPRYIAIRPVDAERVE